MRRRWNLALPALATAFSLACSAPVPIAEDERNATGAANSPLSEEAVSIPPILLDDPIGVKILPTGPLEVDSSEIFAGDFEPIFSSAGIGLSGVKDALGELTGRYEVSVTRLADDCTWGPDVPFLALRGWELGSGEIEYPFSQTYFTTLVQRGDAVGFELGEGIVFARSADGLLTDLERVGAEGVTHYFDGFTVARAGEDDDRLLISGESARPSGRRPVGGHDPGLRRAPGE